jgi:hypothetical protein
MESSYAPSQLTQRTRTRNIPKERPLGYHAEVKNRTLILLLLNLFPLCAPDPAHAVENADLQKQIDALSREIKELKSNRDDTAFDDSEGQSVRSFLSDNLTFGGFFETAVTSISGPDTRGQVSAASHTLGLNLAATFDEHFRFVSQVLTSLSFPLVNAENDPRAAAVGLPAQRTFTGFSALSLPAQGYLEYAWSDAFRAQFGLGYVPFGIALQQRELVLFVRRAGPQILRTPQFVSPLWTGMHLSGSFFTGSGRMGYNVYSVTPIEEPDTVGMGARAWWNPASESLVFGLSSQSANQGGDTYHALGADTELRLGPVRLLSEAVIRLQEGENPWSAYVEPSFPIYRDLVLLYTFADFANSVNSRTGVANSSFPNPYRRLEYGGGFNWLPLPAARVRLGVFLFNYLGDTAVINGQDRDLVAFDLSAGVAF